MMSHFKQVNQLFDQSENPISCNYYDTDDLNRIVINESDLTVIHLNISSQALHIDKLKLFFSLIKTKFDIICISESRITKNNSLTTNLTSLVITHGCSNHWNLEMEAECLTKHFPYLNLNISRTKNGRNKL